ncbi:phasin family protein [Rhodoblastus sp.]|uniref:phasin family protein n=1 Tax=Rhodoblastus sp. TaxID=1962975 RepID=UPI003F9785D7
MVKKLKELASANDMQLVATIRESASQIWLAGLGAFAKAQEEGGKVFEALVKEGESVQDRAKKVADDKFTEVKSKATESWDKLEQVFEDRVARALNSLSVPSKRDIDDLSARVHELTTATKKLSAAMGHPAEIKSHPAPKTTHKA